MSHSQEVRIYRVYGKPCQAEPACIQIYVANQENRFWRGGNKLYLSSDHIFKAQKRPERDCDGYELTGLGYRLGCYSDHWRAVRQDAPFRRGDRIIVQHALDRGNSLRKVFHTFDTGSIKQVKITSVREWNAFKVDFYTTERQIDEQRKKLQLDIDEAKRILSERHELLDRKPYPDIEKRIAKFFL